MFHLYGSIAVNAASDVCIGFSRTDSTKFIEAAFTGRRGSYTPGYMEPVTVLKAGESSYVNARWGDYSATVVDPSDDHTFWTLQEYAASDGHDEVRVMDAAQGEQVLHRRPVLLLPDIPRHDRERMFDRQPACRIGLQPPSMKERASRHR